MLKVQGAPVLLQGASGWARLLSPPQPNSRAAAAGKQADTHM